MTQFAKGVVGDPVPIGIELRVKDATDGWQVWRTAADACSVTFATNVCWYFEEVTYYVLSGTGGCKVPAIYQLPNDLKPAPPLPNVTIGEFWFNSLVYSPT